MTIEIRDASLTLGNKNVLDNVSACFQESTLTIILGPNGTGKSSLLKLLSREWQSNGQLSYYQQASSQWKPQILAKSMGVLPQYSNLTFAFTVQEVVELGGLTLRAPQQDIANIAKQKMQEMDVIHLANRRYPTLSGGEKQRVHFARVLTQLAQSPRPPILLLDEPTSALDIRHQHNTMQRAKDYAKNGATVVAVIHDVNLAAQYADRILMLHHGKIVEDGNPLHVLTAQKIENTYGWPVHVIAHPHANYPVVLG